MVVCTIRLRDREDVFPSYKKRETSRVTQQCSGELKCHACIIISIKNELKLSLKKSEQFNLCWKLNFQNGT
jgi:hypothetical protein